MSPMSVTGMIGVSTEISIEVRGQFVGFERRETRVLCRRRDRAVRDDLVQRVLRAGVADAPAQFAVHVQRHERT